jgi:hypothetical protein
VEELAENVYLFTYEVHRSLFVATDEAVLATDPQSPEAAKHFVEEIRKVSRAPIKYSSTATIDVPPGAPSATRCRRPP